MNVRVLLFARAKDLAGSASLTLDLPHGATVADLRQALAVNFTRLADFLPRSAVAVGGELASDEVFLPENAEVALLPPVSGG